MSNFILISHRQRINFKQNIFNFTLNRLIFTLSFLFALYSCTKDDDKIAFNDIPVVESYLIKNNPVSLTVSRKTPFEDNVTLSDDILDQLQIKISYNNQTRIIPSVGKGVYRDPSLKPQEGITYKLEFVFNNQLVTSSTDVPKKPVGFHQSVTVLEVQSFDFSGGFPTGPITIPEPVKLTWTNNDEGYYMVVIENTEVSPVPIRDFGDNTPPGRFFRNEPTQGKQFEIQSMSFQYYGNHRLILYHMNPEYAELYKDNGNSSQNLTNPATNVKNGLGIFTGLNADTLMLNVIKK